MNEVETAILDCNSRYFGMDTLQLMENAGRSVAEEIENRYSHGNSIGIFCGRGNNGGDGFVAARFLAERNDVSVYLVGSPADIQTEEARKNYSILKNARVEITIILDTKDMKVLKHDIVVDALLGTGIRGELREPYKTLVKKINGSSAAKVSVDIPTGYGTTTQVAADLVISMHYEKVPSCVTATIGVPRWVESLVGPGDVKFLERRRKDSHKGDNGRVLIVGGSELYHGAPIFSGKAASKISDLVFVACPQPAVFPIRATTADFIVHPLSSEHLVVEDIPTIQTLAESCDIVLIGPGLGVHPETQKACQQLFSLEIPKVVDADGLKALKGVLDTLAAPAILTPHHGEFAQVFGSQSVQDAALKHDCIIVQKGVTDIITTGTRTKYNHTGNAGMTTGGTGDVLAGLVTGFGAVNDLFQASCAAAFVSGMAGDLCYQNVGFRYSASDVLDQLQPTLQWCETF
ncbi:MAG: NAD(P)H-hydrate dehydratase [Theionarchaea archaeon]|nr:NAD(P)H-hydrate dehydratase [Theionarchaea archaeon]MBU7037609.1 NAD(P)H-hydrate dehydratase [Theionarchaea archaeon]